MHCVMTIIVYQCKYDNYNIFNGRIL